MRITAKSLIVVFVKAGQLTGPAFLFYTFMGMFFHGEFVWVEPNMFILIFEVVLSALWLIGSIVDTIQTVQKMPTKSE